MNAGEAMIPVELKGGPLDGHFDEVPQHETGLDGYLFQYEAAGRRSTQSYRLTGTTCRAGTRWVLQFVCEVASWPLASMLLGTGNTGEEAA